VLPQYQRRPSALTCNLSPAKGRASARTGQPNTVSPDSKLEHGTAAAHLHGQGLRLLLQPAHLRRARGVEAAAAAGAAAGGRRVWAGQLHPLHVRHARLEPRIRQACRVVVDAFGYVTAAQCLMSAVLCAHIIFD